ncbi:MAG: hypothetical protein LBQ61_07225 [Spirochaetales bacterium]|jgi:A/G-specific adenine glycosylase|nr:hypothetical protein [Spirochaetales bacterium]
MNSTFNPLLSSREALLDWFETQGTAYPWGDPRREARIDPYKVWISEIMLQQTVVSGVLPYFNRWISRFPGVRELAAAEEGEALRYWEGLGYYSRARNLLAAARKIRDQYGGVLPSRADQLKALPGIGEYTARAILSLAFNQDLAVLDANVKRIARRLEGLVELSPAGETALQTRLDQSLPPGRAGCFNAALMQFGQKICKRVPACLRDSSSGGNLGFPDSESWAPCPLQRNCRAFLEGLVPLIPGARQRMITEKAADLAVLLWQNRVFLYPKRRGLGQGLYHLPRKPRPAEVKSSGEPPAGALPGDLPTWTPGPVLKTRVHTYTRYRETLYPRVYFFPGDPPPLPCGPAGGEPGFADSGDLGRGGWFTPGEAQKLGFFSVYRQILDEALLSF